MSSKPKWLQNLVEFLVDNLAVLLTIGFAGYIIYRHEVAQLAVSTNELLTAILGVLGLLATSEIVERYRRLGTIEKSVKRALSLLESRFTDRPSAIAFFEKLPDIDSYVQGASQIDLCGVTLVSTINRQFSNLRECLEQGATIRLLIIDPDSLGPQMAAHRVEPADVDYYRTRLEAVLRDIDYLHKSWAEYQMRQSSLSEKGALSARLLPYVPSFGLLSFDANRSNGIAFVEIYPHGTGHKTQPTFDLTPHRDGMWYEYFVDQFEQMWNSARPWNPQTAANAREESSN
jgi:hypothetical protein